MALDVQNDVRNNIRHDEYLRFKTVHSSVCCCPTLGSAIILLSTHYSASLLDHTYNPSDMSTCTTFCLHLS